MCVCVCLSFLQLFSIVVFATITAEGYINNHSSQDTKCMFNENDSACNYGVGIGVLAFMACIVMLVIDANFPQISNAKQRKIIVIGDLVFSGEGTVSHLSPPKCFPPHVFSRYWWFHCWTAVWTLLWFICFCVLANQWAHTPATFHGSHDAARSVVAFSFFSIITWVRPSESVTSFIVGQGLCPGSIWTTSGG